MFLALGALLVVGIAMYAVGSAVGRLENTALPAVLEVDDAVDWIAERLPEETAGQLSRDDVVDVVGWYLESFAEAGLATTHGQALGDEALADGAGDAEAASWPHWTTPWTTWWPGGWNDPNHSMPWRLRWWPTCSVPTWWRWEPLVGRPAVLVAIRPTRRPHGARAPQD